MDFIKVWDGRVDNSHRGMIKPPSFEGEIIQSRKPKKGATKPIINSVDRRQKTKLFNLVIGHDTPIKPESKTGQLYRFVLTYGPISDRKCESYLVENFGSTRDQATHIIKNCLRAGYLRSVEVK